ncbi:MAG: FecR family protein [Elusimicrobiota bacterium]
MSTQHKQLKFLLVIFNFIFLIFNCLYSIPPAGVVTSIDGDVQLLPYKNDSWQSAKVGTFLYEGDTIKTLEKSYTAVTLTNGGEMKINQNTEFSFEITSQIESVGSQIKAKMGQIWSKVRPKTKFEIHTPVAIVAVRGTEFDINLIGGKLYLAVYEGKVNLKNKYGEVDVKAGDETSAGADTPPEPPKEMKKEKQEKKWQEEKISKGSIKIETKTTKIVCDIAFELIVSVYDADGKLDKTAKNEITVKSDSTAMLFSADSMNWNKKQKIIPADGIAKLYGKVSLDGLHSIFAVAENYIAGKLDVLATQPKTKNLKLKMKSDTGENELILKFKKKE